MDCGCENTGVFGYLRRPKGDKPEGELLVLLNFTDESAEISLTYDGFMGKLIDTGFGQEKMKHTSGKEKIIPKQLPAFSGWIGKSRIDK